MTDTGGSLGSKPKNKYTKKDTVETLSNPFDQFFGNPRSVDYEGTSELGWKKETNVQKQPQRREFSLFNYSEYYERELVKKQIKELAEQIKKEIELLKKADKSLLSEVRDIEKLTVEQLPEKPGIYHIRFLEIVLRILQTLRAKIGESKTWMQALISKKKKRGSLFLALSKKKGTLYSLSQELQSARAVQ